MTGALTAAAVIPTATGRSVAAQVSQSVGAKTSRRCDIPRRGIATYTLTAPRPRSGPAAVINALREFYNTTTPIQERLSTQWHGGLMSNIKKRAKHLLGL